MSIGWNIRTLDEVDSTNGFLLKSIKDGLREGVGIVTKFQLAGKGQIGNLWESEVSQNLLISLLFEPTFLSPMRQFLLSKTISIAIAKTLQPFVANVKIKWPNDIYIDDCKLAGILIENILMGSNISYSVVGIGLNINQTLFSLAPNPVSLKQICAKDFDISSIQRQLLDSISTYYEVLKRNNISEINRLYKTLLYRADGFFEYRDQTGNFEACIKEVEDSGRLILETREGELKRYWFKEVEIVI